MKLDRRRILRRINDKMLSQSHYHQEWSDRRRGSDRRLETRNPIYVWCHLNKKELPLYLFIFTTCILIAAFSSFMSRRLYHESKTYSSNTPEKEDVLAIKKIEENRRLLERTQLGSEL